MHSFRRKPGGAQLQPEGSRGALLCYYESAKPTFTDTTVIGPPERLPIDLLATGAPPDACNKSGVSILDYACMYHHHAVVRQLASTGININEVSTAYSLPALMYADAEDARVLLDHGANVDAVGYQAHTGLFSGDAKKVDLLLSRGANIEMADANGDTPLMNACFHGQDDIVLKLLSHHPSVQKQSKSGATCAIPQSGQGLQA